MGTLGTLGTWFAYCVANGIGVVECCMDDDDGEDDDVIAVFVAPVNDA